MSYILKAKTQEGYIIKILGELLQNNIKTACFEVDSNGLKLRMMDSHRIILIDLFLDAENFSIYKFKSDHSLYLGINLSHFHKMLRSIKKKDSLILFIKEDAPNNLGIKVIPKENNRITTSYIKVQSIQNLDIELPIGYNKSIIVTSSEYQKMCKDINNISSTINIRSKNLQIKFWCNAGSVYSREISFGEDCDSSDEEDEEEEFVEDFETEQLIKIMKIAGLNKTLQIYPKINLPLLIKSNVGNLGKLSIYLKNKKQIEEDEIKEM